MYVKKAKSLRLGLNEGDEVTLKDEKIDQVDSFPHLDSMISKDDAFSKYVIKWLRVFFFKVEKGLEE